MEIKMNFKPINVLLVDDDAADQRLVKHILTAFSREVVQFNVETAKTLSEAVNCLSSDKYDVVLLDLGLPDSHGIDTVQRVHKANQKVPIVVLTGLDDEEIGLEAIKCGAEDYIVKGAPLEYLLVRTIRYAIERKKVEGALRESESKYRTLLDNLTQNIFLKDVNLVYISCNENYARDLKIRPKEIAGKTDYDFYPKELAERYRTDDKKVMESGETKEIEEKYIKDGKELVVHTVKTPVKDDQDNIIGILGIFWDITEQKEAQRRQDQLTEEVKSVNQELEDFAYVISHDLKAPLRGIRTLADWISTDYADKLGEKGGEQMKLLLSRADRMHNLIDGVLQYSRVGRVREEMVRVDLNEFVPDVIDMVAPPQNITVTVENELPVIECELTRIMQVFQNLVSNAVKYMDKPKGQVKIDCVDENGFWKFSVTDNGPGIEEKHFEKIFRIFQTLSPRDEFESTGIGLTIAKKIVELYGGRIWVESKVSQGSTFFFTLPKQESEVTDNERLQANIAC